MTAVSKIKKNTPVGRLAKEKKKKIKKRSHHFSDDIFTSPKTTPELYFSFYFENNQLLYDRLFLSDTGLSTAGRHNTGLSSQQFQKLTRDIFDAFDPLSGDGFEFEVQRDEIDVFIDLSINHFRRIFSDRDQEIIRKLCDDAALDTHAVTIVFRHFEFHYPWGLLNFRKDVSAAADIYSLDELTQSLIGSYAVAARVPLRYEEEYCFGQAELSASMPKLVFAGGDLEHVQSLERPFFKRLDRAKRIALRDFQASSVERGRIESSLFAPDGTCYESIFHIACHADELRGMGQTLFLDGNATVSVTRLQNQNITFSGRELVFLNACETASYKTSDYADLVRSFVKGKNSVLALVGTDCTVGDRVSARFALQVYIFFICGGLSLGDSIVNARRKLAKRGSLVGYAYSVFGNPYLKRMQNE